MSSLKDYPIVPDMSGGRCMAQLRTVASDEAQCANAAIDFGHCGIHNTERGKVLRGLVALAHEFREARETPKDCLARWHAESRSEDSPDKVTWMKAYEVAYELLAHRDVEELDSLLSAPHNDRSKVCG